MNFSATWGVAHDLAMSELQRGDPVTYHGCIPIGLQIVSGLLRIDVGSRFEPELMTRARAEYQLQQAREALTYLTRGSRAFAVHTAGLPVEIVLSWSEDRGRIPIAREADDGMQFFPGHPMTQPGPATLETQTPALGENGVLREDVAIFIGNASNRTYSIRIRRGEKVPCATTLNVSPARWDQDHVCVEWYRGDFGVFVRPIFVGSTDVIGVPADLRRNEYYASHEGPSVHLTVEIRKDATVVAKALLGGSEEMLPIVVTSPKPGDQTDLSVSGARLDRDSYLRPSSRATSRPASGRSRARTSDPAG